MGQGVLMTTTIQRRWLVPWGGQMSPQDFGGYRVTCPSCGWWWKVKIGKRRRWSRFKVERVRGPYFPDGSGPAARTLTSEQWLDENPDCARALRIQ